jgi:5-methylcytosine-specific restriction endonuclease McrA
MARRYHDAEWVRERYHGDGMTQAEIADECDVHVKTIRTWMKKLGVETRDPVGKDHPMYGRERDEETKAKISDSLEGREISTENQRKLLEANTGRSPSVETRRKISEALSGRELSEETRRRMSESTAGKANPNWRGGFSDSYGAGWSVVRDTVRSRDEVCQECGADGSTRQLHVHHIVPVRLFDDSPEFEIEDAHRQGNLVLLCDKCHVRADHDLIGFEHDLDEDEIPEAGRSKLNK